MRITPYVLPLLLLGFLAERTDAGDLHLRKMSAVHRPAKRDRPRSKLRVRGRLASHQLPRDFQFSPSSTPLGLSVGGVFVLTGADSGEWRQRTLYSWSYRERGDRRVKLDIEFGRGEFTFRGKRLDLEGMAGPLDCDVFLFLGDDVFGTRVDGQEKGSRWAWVPVGGGLPSKAPGMVPAPPGGDEAPGSSPVAVSFRVLAHGTQTFDPTSNTPWVDRLVVRDAGTFQREWSRMFGSTSAPAVNFATEQVLLFYDIADYYALFEISQDATGLTVNYRPARRMGPIRCLYRAVAVPRTAGGVAFRKN